VNSKMVFEGSLNDIKPVEDMAARRESSFCRLQGFTGFRLWAR